MMHEHSGRPWYPVPWARDETKYLRARENKIENLRHEEQEQCFGKVTLYANDGESHPSDIAKCISRKGTSGIPGYS